ncbi:MAG: GNAT family N-acetyltransferase [Chloroflexi bacterium]|nr:GNAT family N-acetyltransferase [Chloroflexota bacterium]
MLELDFSFHPADAHPEILQMTAAPQIVATNLVRPFRWTDAPGLHDLMHAVGDRGHRAERHDLANFDAELKLPRVKPTSNVFVIEVSGGVAGYSSVYPELDIGRAVVTIAVAPDQRRRGLGRALMTRALERARSIGARMVHVPATAGDQASGAMLQRFAFSPVRHFLRMICKVAPSERKGLDGGYEIRQLRSDEASALAALQNAVFAGTWGYSANTPEEVEARLALPGRGPANAYFICEAEKPVAYAWSHLYHDANGLIGTVYMTGVHPSYRRLGLGESVVSGAVRALFESGAGQVDLEVDSQNILAVNLYERLAFTRRGGTFWYELGLRQPPWGQGSRAQVRGPGDQTYPRPALGPGTHP